MDENTLIRTIALAVPETVVTNREVIARDFLNMAVSSVSRIKGVAFNERWVTVNMVAGQDSYVLGVDIKDARNFSELWRTDASGWPIEIMQPERFHSYTTGSTASGPPICATVLYEEGNVVLHVYPTPDSAYSLKGMIRKKDMGFDDIPEQYRDILYSIAVTMIRAVRDPNVAIELSKAGLKDVRADTMVGYTGSQIIPARPLYDDFDDSPHIDSGRLR